MIMKKTIISLFAILLLCLQLARGQNNLVSNAIQAFSEGKYEHAFELTGNALANPDRLSGDYVPAAFYYHAKARIQVLRIAMEEGDQEKLSLMQNALIESYFDYKQALKTAGDKLKTDIQNDLQGLYNPILQTGLGALNMANDRRQPANVRESALQSGKGYLEAARDISPTYLACDLLGQCYLALLDSTAAYEQFRQSVQAYIENPPSSPDFLVAYVFFRKAIIERYGMHDHPLALSTLMKGQQLLSKEYSRAQASGISQEQQNDYENGMKDLTGFELDIYLNDKSLSQKAIIRFQEVLMIYPEDYDVHISYANLMEDIDPLLAIDAYETAISIDDSRELAWYNLGAMYNNIGSELYLKGLNHDDDALADSLYNEANNSFRKAYLNMEEAYKINPKSIQTIRALVQLANSLGLDEKADFYREKEMELRGF